MSNASFCPACGECISDGCAMIDDDGNELPVENYTPCRCETGIDANNRIVDWEKAKQYMVASLTDDFEKLLAYARELANEWVPDEWRGKEGWRIGRVQEKHGVRHLFED